MPEADTTDARRYVMTISRNTIDKLGIKLYDKVSAVLAELIANAYDADATEVTITVPAFGRYLASKANEAVQDHGFHITVEDNGHGMTYDEVMEFYLKVGPDRRKRPVGGATSREKGRPVMGRKGIGKLAPFGICREIEVLTAGGEATTSQFTYSHFVLDYDGIMGEILDEDYAPLPSVYDQQPAPQRGTKITLRHFGYRKVPDRMTLMRQLSARFGLDRADWRVRIVDGSGLEPPIELSGAELEVDVLESTRIEVDGRPVPMPDGSTLPVSGWIAYAKESYKDDVMAGVRIYARGKIVSQTRDFDVPTGFRGEFKLRSYLTGFITAEWLDDDEGEDLIRSDRQDILWSSERGEALRAWGQTLIKEIAGRAEGSVRTNLWEEFKSLSEIERIARSAFPKDAELRESVLQVAKIAIRGADGDAIRDPDFRAGAIDFALSVAPHKVLVRSIHDLASDENTTFATLVTLFRRERLAELYAVGTAAKRRVDALDRLKQLKGPDVREKDLQSLLEEAPWIIAPEWEVLLTDKSLETFRRVFEIWYKQTYNAEISTTTIDRPTKEPDFIFVQTRQKLRIVEIKRPQYRLTDAEFKRAHGYLTAVRKFVRENPTLGFQQKDVALVIVADCLNLKDDAYVEMIETGLVNRYTWTEVENRAMSSNIDLVDAFERAKKPAETAPNLDGANEDK